MAEVRRYLAAVNEATAGRGGFSVTSAFADDSGSEVLVEGTAFHGEGPFVRTVVHRLRLSEGRLVEFRDHPFDQQSEDRFWSARVPAQRDGERADATAERHPKPPTGATAAPVIAAAHQQPHHRLTPRDPGHDRRCSPRQPVTDHGM